MRTKRTGYMGYIGAMMLFALAWHAVGVNHAYGDGRFPTPEERVQEAMKEYSVVVRIIDADTMKPVPEGNCTIEFPIAYVNPEGRFDTDFGTVGGKFKNGVLVTEPFKAAFTGKRKGVAVYVSADGYPHYLHSAELSPDVPKDIEVGDAKPGWTVEDVLLISTADKADLVGSTVRLNLEAPDKTEATIGLTEKGQMILIDEENQDKKGIIGKFTVSVAKDDDGGFQVMDWEAFAKDRTLSQGEADFVRWQPPYPARISLRMVSDSDDAEAEGGLQDGFVRAHPERNIEFRFWPLSLVMRHAPENGYREQLDVTGVEMIETSTRGSGKIIPGMSFMYFRIGNRYGRISMGSDMITTKGKGVVTIKLYCSAQTEENNRSLRSRVWGEPRR